MENTIIDYINCQVKLLSVCTNKKILMKRVCDHWKFNSFQPLQYYQTLQWQDWHVQHKCGNFVVIFPNHIHWTLIGVRRTRWTDRVLEKIHRGKQISNNFFNSTIRLKKNRYSRPQNKSEYLHLQHAPKWRVTDQSDFDHLLTNQRRFERKMKRLDFP